MDSETAPQPWGLWEEDGGWWIPGDTLIVKAKIIKELGKFWALLPV